TTVDAIVAANPGMTAGTTLRIGQVLCIPPAGGAAGCPAGYRTHTIVSGDTLWQLARTYGTTVDAIVAANPGMTAGTILRIGQVLCIPPAGGAAGCPAGYRTHTIVSGDTLWQLARTYGTTVDAIVAANPGMTAGTTLRIGQVLCIPPVGGAAGCPEGYRTHTIVQGDTLSKLATTYSTTVDEILAANPGLTVTTTLRIGQVLCIPPVRACNGTLYVLKRGDTLYNLALANGITVEDILRANPQINPRLYRAGDTICLPVGAAPGTAPAMPALPAPSEVLPEEEMMPAVPATCPDDMRSYTVQAGDTWEQIARKFDVSYHSILHENRHVDMCQPPVAGTLLCLMPAMTPPTCGTGRVYVIKEGMTIHDVAEKCGVTVEELLMANPTCPPSAFTPGRKICLPK
ncbi:MAG: LysM peptidoglycan-binding domain-containing protein, partial [Eubacteriales bacterium]|nr:LysM peptidoglycan-binding domain-containing protein [Eubacteriales bacterium]